MRPVWIALTLFLGACARTGIPAIDNITDPYKSCSVDVSLQNSSSKTLMLSAWAAQTVDTSACRDNETADKTISVAPGQSGSVHLEMSCRSCGIHANPTVYEGSNKSTMKYSGSFQTSVVCTDTQCVGH